MSGRSLYVLHDLGAVDAGGLWRAASSVDLRIEAPDQPGHGTPAPTGGNYDVMSAAFHTARSLAGGRADLDVVVGVGVNGWSAHLVAIAGAAQALVLVDGLGEPWIGVQERATRRRARARRILDDPAALAPHDAAAHDPRLAYTPDPHGSREFALEAAAATSVPTLIVATTPPDAAVVAAFDTATVADVPSRTPESVLPAIATWLADL